LPQMYPAVDGASCEPSMRTIRPRSTVTCRLQESGQSRVQAVEILERPQETGGDGASERAMAAVYRGGAPPSGGPRPRRTMGRPAVPGEEIWRAFRTGSWVRCDC